MREKETDFERDGLQIHHGEHVGPSEELASISPEQKTLMGMMISELQLSKMGLMTFVI